MGERALSFWYLTCKGLFKMVFSCDTVQLTLSCSELPYLCPNEVSCF